MSAEAQRSDLSIRRSRRSDPASLPPQCRNSGHELVHVRNHDTLTMTITTTIAGAISMLAQFARSSRWRPCIQWPGLGIVGSILMPSCDSLAAMIVQMAINRTREYAADNLGARISGRPDALASALIKISRIAEAVPQRHRRDPSNHCTSLYRQPAVRPRDGTIYSPPIHRPRIGSLRWKNCRAKWAWIVLAQERPPAI